MPSKSQRSPCVRLPSAGFKVCNTTAWFYSHIFIWFAYLIFFFLLLVSKNNLKKKHWFFFSCVGITVAVHLFWSFSCGLFWFSTVDWCNLWTKIILLFQQDAFSFSCLIVLGIISTVLNRSSNSKVKVGVLVLFLMLRGIFLYLELLCVSLRVFHKHLCHVEEFSAHSFVVSMYYSIDWFCWTTLRPWSRPNPTWSWWNSFNMLLGLMYV